MDVAPATGDSARTGSAKTGLEKRRVRVSAGVKSRMAPTGPGRQDQGAGGGEDVGRMLIYWTGVTSRPLLRSRGVVALRATASPSARPPVISTCVRLTMPNFMGVRISRLLMTRKT